MPLRLEAPVDGPIEERTARYDDGGTLVRDTLHVATMGAAGADPSGGLREGWHLKLNPGWVVQPGQRPGDLTVARTGNAPLNN